MFSKLKVTWLAFIVSSIVNGEEVSDIIEPTIISITSTKNTHSSNTNVISITKIREGKIMEINITKIIV